MDQDDVSCVTISMPCMRYCNVVKAPRQDKTKRAISGFGMQKCEKKTMTEAEVREFRGKGRRLKQKCEGLEEKDAD